MVNFSKRKLLSGMASGAFLSTGNAQTSKSSHVVPVVKLGKSTLRMVAAWPNSLMGPYATLKRLASKAYMLSGGALQIEIVFANQTKSSALEALSSVASGEFDMAHSTSYYWTKHSPAYNFFSTVPFGMLASEHYAWLRYGGGYALWMQLCAQSGIFPLPCGNTGVQMGGWMKKPLESLTSLKGLRLRYPGLGGEILRSMGAEPVMLPAIDIIPALNSGRLDGAEWVSPWGDIEMGFQDVCNYYYAPGFHEPSHTLELIINQSVWSRLSQVHRSILETICWGEYIETQAQFDYENSNALDQLKKIKNLQILRFPNEIVKEFRKRAPEVIRSVAEADPFSRLVHDSYYQFLRKQLRWSELAERAYWQARYI
jgi:TRAP-type mannitol/chloroaromatic compound transport system substrate-binding protein